MSGQSGHIGCKRPWEDFLTSSSLSFSSLSSSCTLSSEDAIEISTKAARISHEDERRGKVLKAGSEMCVTSHVRMEPAPPSSRPVDQLMNRCIGTHYDSERIPASVFAKTGGDLNWSEISNDSLFSLRMSTCRAFCQSNIIPEDGEFLAYSPSLLEDAEDAEEEKRSSQVIEQAKSVVTSVETNTQVVSCGFDQLYQAPLTKPQAASLPLGEKKNKKRKKTRRSKKTNQKEKKQDMCCIWSWLCSCVLKCKCNLHCCYIWRKCCCCCCCSSREPKAIVL